MFTVDDFVAGQVTDLKDVLINTTPVITPFSTLLLSKKVKASGPEVSWIEESINENSAKTIGEGGDAPNHEQDGAALLSNYLELFAATALVSNTSQASNAVGVSDLLAKDVAMKSQAIKLRIEEKCIHGIKSYVSTTKTWTTGGILEQVHTDNRVSGVALTPAKFEEMLEKMYNAGTNMNMICFLPARMKLDINGFAGVTFLAREKFLGFDADYYDSPFGQVSFVNTRKLTDSMFVVNPDYLEMPELIPFRATNEAVSGSKKSVYLETQVGIKLLNQKAAASFTITP